MADEEFVHLPGCPGHLTQCCPEQVLPQLTLDLDSGLAFVELVQVAQGLYVPLECWGIGADVLRQGAAVWRDVI